MRKLFTLMAVVAAMALVPPGHASTYPDKPIRLVLPAATGGAADTLSRLIARSLSERFGQPVVVENKPGGAAILGMTTLANSPADGYTIGVSFAGAMSVNPSMYRNLPYDPVKSFDPVAILAVSPLVLAVNPKLGPKNLKDLLDMARKDPGKLTFASTGTGSTQHLSMELLKSTTGIDLLHVPYKGSAAAVMDVQSGLVSMMSENAITVVPHIQAGTLIAVAVGTAERIKPLPDVPTIAESGYPGYSAAGWYGVIVPKGVDPAIIRTLNAAVSEIIAKPEVQATLRLQGMEPMIDTPEGFGRFILQERDKWAKVIKGANVPVQDLR